MTTQSSSQSEKGMPLLARQGLFMMCVAYCSCGGDIDQDHLHAIQERIGYWFLKEFRLPNHDAMAEQFCTKLVAKFQRIPKGQVDPSAAELIRNIHECLNSNPKKKKRHMSRIVRDWVHIIARDGKITPQERNIVLTYATALKCNGELVERLIDDARRNQEARRLEARKLAEHFSSGSSAPVSNSGNQGQSSEAEPSKPSPAPKSFSSLAAGHSQQEPVEQSTSGRSDEGMLDLSQELNDAALGAELLEGIYDEEWNETTKPPDGGFDMTPD